MTGNTFGLERRHGLVKAATTLTLTNNINKLEVTQ